MCRRALTTPDPHPQQPTIQLQKPSLTRRLVGSAKINLNDYWNVFEAILDPNSSNVENENLDNERRLAKLNLGENNVNLGCTASSTLSPCNKNISL